MQGFNMGRYVPPDFEGVTSGNRLHNKRHHAPGGGSSSSSAAPQTVRFEMPFPVWCGTCARPTVIGQGVRFNAAKRRVGAHHSTPIFSFTFRHADCGGELEVRTDPAATDYVVERGGRRRLVAGEGEQGGDEEDLVSPAALKRASLANLASRGLGGSAASSSGDPDDRQRGGDREAAFAHLEKTIADRAALARASTRVDELAADSDRLGWDRPYERNALLRRGFRADRKERERAAVADADVMARLGLANDGDGDGNDNPDDNGDGLVLGPELDVDRARAALVDFGRAPDDDEALTRPLFAPGPARDRDAAAGGPRRGGDAAGTRGDDVAEPPRAPRSSPALAGYRHGRRGRLKSAVKKEMRRESLIEEIGRNTRRTMDPFLEGWGRESPQRSVVLPGLKRKRNREGEATGETPNPSPALADPPDPELPEVEAPRTGLVSYDSD
ncbi:hypothetical protein RB598_002544 [Gaeumannomyces tritici]